MSNHTSVVLKRIITSAVIFSLAGCALYPRTGTDWLSRREAERRATKQDEQYGYQPSSMTVEWLDSGGADNPCLAVGWMTTRVESRNTFAHWLQSRHVLPVRKTRMMVFAPTGKCAPPPIDDEVCQ